MISKLGKAKAISVGNQIVTGFFYIENKKNYIYDFISKYKYIIDCDSLCYNTDITDEDGHEIYSNDIREIIEGHDRGKQFRIYYIPGGFVIKESLWLFNIEDFTNSDKLITISIVDPQTLSWILNATKHVKNYKLDI